jgi:hypothetical protein
VRQGDGTADFEANVTVRVKDIGNVKIPIFATTKNGKRFSIALSGPLTTDHPASPSIRELREKTNEIHVVVINELLIRGNIPADP